MTQSLQSTGTVHSQLTLKMEIPGAHLLQGFKDALPLTQLLDAQGYLVAGTFGDILWQGKWRQETRNGRLRYLGCPNKAQRDGGSSGCKGNVKMVLPSILPSWSP